MQHDPRFGQIDPADYVQAAREGSRAEQVFHASRLRLLARATPTAGRAVLDVGSGTGVLALELAKDAAVTAVDLSPQHIEALERYATQAGVEVTGVVASAAELPFEDDRFDVVYLASVVHLVPEPGPLLREAERVCRRDGRIVVAGPWRFHPKSSRRVKRLLGKTVETTTQPFSRAFVEQRMLRSRLVDEHTDRLMGYVVTVWEPSRKP